MLVGYGCYITGQVLLISVPAEGFAKYLLLSISLVFDGFGFGALAMLSESLIALNVDPDERARILAILYVIIMAATSPFGWIGGILSDISRDLPFILNICLLAASVVITLIYYLVNPRSSETAQEKQRF